MKTLKNFTFICVLITLALFNQKCSEENPIPKPKSYLRIDFPPKEYNLISSDCPYSFLIPDYSIWINKFKNTPECYKTLIFPEFKAEIICSYKVIDSNFFELIEKVRSNAYEHSFKANAIIEESWNNKQKDVYGYLYNIKGNVACNYMFYVTDSSKHFFTGELLFQTRPNYDSLKPSISFIEEDIKKMIESFEWG
jgi:gliding motility-associated lipoprotein GldD